MMAEGAMAVEAMDMACMAAERCKQRRWEGKGHSSRSAGRPHKLQHSMIDSGLDAVVWAIGEYSAGTGRYMVASLGESWLCFFRLGLSLSTGRF